MRSGVRQGRRGTELWSMRQARRAEIPRTKVPLEVQRRAHSKDSRTQNPATRSSRAHSYCHSHCHKQTDTRFHGKHQPESSLAWPMASYVSMQICKWAIVVCVLEIVLEIVFSLPSSWGHEERKAEKARESIFSLPRERSYMYRKS